MKNYIAIFLLFMNFSTVAESLGEMHGIRFKDYASFEKKWNLVTVRYRTDTQEQRFVYANEKAYKTLMARKDKYPDGSVFGKIGIATVDDPDFPSSKIPAGSLRMQLMVKDSKKYASTGGWGYAIFDRMGKNLEGQNAKSPESCYACHQILAKRDYVFSLPMNFEVASSEKSPFIFETVSRESLPEKVRAALPAKERTVQFLTGSLRKNAFQGTIDEIRPALIKQSAKMKMPAVFLSEEKTQYSGVYASETVDSRCPQGLASFEAFWTTQVKEADGSLALGKAKTCGEK